MARRSSSLFRRWRRISHGVSFPLNATNVHGGEAGRSKPITEILQQTPEIPSTCQWCLFLRNHDELTLEMVTDIERDYMYDVYAADKTMRLNLGIRGGSRRCWKMTAGVSN